MGVVQPLRRRPMGLPGPLGAGPPVPRPRREHDPSGGGVSSLGDLVPRSASERPERVALIAGDRRITYGKLADRVRGAAWALHDLGVEKGDRVALLLGNQPEFVEALHGAFRVGAVVVPLNVMLTPDEVGAVLADADAEAVIADRAFLPTVLAVRDRLAGLDHVLVTGGRRTPRGTRSYEKALRGAGDPPAVEMGESDLALLAYTAGTTANPKGAVLTHGNLMANLDQ